MDIQLQPGSPQETQMIRLLKKQLFWQRLTAVLLAVLIGAGITLAVQAAPRVRKIDQELKHLSERANGVLTELEEMADSLNGLDLEGLVDNTNQMVRSSEKNLTDMAENVSQAVKNLEDLDVDSFNQAIGRLNSIAGTFSSLFGR